MINAGPDRKYREHATKISADFPTICQRITPMPPCLFHLTRRMTAITVSTKAGDSLHIQGTCAAGVGAAFTVTNPIFLPKELGGPSGSTSCLMISSTSAAVEAERSAASPMKRRWLRTTSNLMAVEAKGLGLTIK